MSEERNRPGITFWTATTMAVVIVLAAYSMSYPWVCSELIHRHVSKAVARSGWTSGSHPVRFDEAVGWDQMELFYAPHWAVLDCSPKCVKAGYRAYSGWCFRFNGIDVK